VRKAKRAAARRGRRLRIMFTDEARFGRMNRIRPCWAPIGMRPEVAAQLIREYIYLYGAVSPKDGTCVYLIMPTSNTACFQIFLDVLARKFARQDILLVLDGAPNHRCGDLVIPDNIKLLYLPPYSPELNPKENIWDEIREKNLQEFCAQINGCRACQTQAGHPLHRAQSRPCSLHRLLPLHRKLNLM
jgi:transposase